MVLFGLAIFLGCGPTLQVKTDFDHSATFRQYRSFQMGEGQVIEKGSRPEDEGMPWRRRGNGGTRPPEGTLVIDLVDARTQKLVWRAYCVLAEGAGMANPAFIQKAVSRRVREVPPPRPAERDGPSRLGPRRIAVVC